MTDVLTVTANPAVDVATAAERVMHTHKIRCDGLDRDPGGGGINVARVAGRFGATCKALYPVGGPLGELLRGLVAAEGVDSICTEIAGDTRESFTVLDRSHDREYRFVLPGPELAEAEWQALLARVEDLDPPPSFVVASGSLPPGVPDDFYARLAAIAARLGARLVLDTSGKPLAATVGAGVHLVKPNLRELCELIGRRLDTEADWADAASELVASGRAEAVALSLGHHGALLATAEGVWRAPGLPIKVASAVGAGDSFVGGMVWALAAGRELPDAFRYGVAAGSAALLTPGTGLCRREDAERLYRQVSLKAL